MRVCAGSWRYGLSLRVGQGLGAHLLADALVVLPHVARQRRHVGLLHLIEHGLAKRLARDERQRSGLLHLAGGALERLARFVMRRAA